MQYLTEAEKEILLLIARGMLNKQIAAARGVSYTTVRNQVVMILDKLGADTRSQAVYIAVKEGIIH